MSGCFCTGKCREEGGKCPNTVNPINLWNVDDYKIGSAGRLIPIEKIDYCMDREHNPPTHIVIPQGFVYEHVCPTCKKKALISSPSYSLGLKFSTGVNFNGSE